MDDENEWGDLSYEVGYRKPPEHSRFKPGQSGNRKGRPKGDDTALSPENLFEKQLRKKITITENGIPKKISIIEAIGMQVTTKAGQGDSKSITLLLNLLQARPKGRSVREKKLEQEVEKLKALLERFNTPISDEECDLKIQQILETAEMRRQHSLEQAARENGGYDI